MIPSIEKNKHHSKRLLSDKGKLGGAKVPGAEAVRGLDCRIQSKRRKLGLPDLPAGRSTESEQQEVIAHLDRRIAAKRITLTKEAVLEKDSAWKRKAATGSERPPHASEHFSSTSFVVAPSEDSCSDISSDEDTSAFTAAAPAPAEKKTPDVNDLNCSFSASSSLSARAETALQLDQAMTTDIEVSAWNCEEEEVVVFAKDSSSRSSSEDHEHKITNTSLLGDDDEKRLYRDRIPLVQRISSPMLDCERKKKTLLSSSPKQPQHQPPQPQPQHQIHAEVWTRTTQQPNYAVTNRKKIQSLDEKTLLRNQSVQMRSPTVLACERKILSSKLQACDDAEQVISRGNETSGAINSTTTISSFDNEKKNMIRNEIESLRGRFMGNTGSPSPTTLIRGNKNTAVSSFSSSRQEPEATYGESDPITNRWRTPDCDRTEDQQEQHNEEMMDGHWNVAANDRADTEDDDTDIERSRHLRILSIGLAANCDPIEGSQDEPNEEIMDDHRNTAANDHTDLSLEGNEEDDDHDDNDRSHHLRSLPIGVTGLAIAVPIPDDEADTRRHLPMAVSFDADSKPTQLRRRRRRRRRIHVLTALALLVLVAIATGLGVAIARARKGSKLLSTPGTDASTNDTFVDDKRERDRGNMQELEDYMRQAIQRVAGLEVLQDENSPYTKALHWIVEEDPMQLLKQKQGSDLSRLVQRFLAAYLYFATTVDGPWASCNPPAEGENDFCFFKKLFMYPDEYEFVPWKRWLSRKTECSWAGMVCDKFGNIREIELNGAQMSGPFPLGITKLPFLETIAFGDGTLRGPLPTELATLKHLVRIELQFNELSGSIPDSWWDARQLKQIDVAGNQIVGSLPPMIGQLRDLKRFFVNQNKLSGSLPSEIGEWRSLLELRLSHNLFEGELPTEIGLLAQVDQLWIHRNSFTGSLPTEIGGLENIWDFRANRNPLTGDLPDEIYKLTTLRDLALHGCNFTGEISPSIGSLVHLDTFRIHDNNFHGEIPTEFGLLTTLEALQLQGNHFFGTLPSGLCALRGNELTELEADCSPSEESGIPEIFCPEGCCTECCNHEGYCSLTGTF